MVIKKRDLLRGVDSAISKTNRRSSSSKGTVLLICSCLAPSQSAGRRPCVCVTGSWANTFTSFLKKKIEIQSDNNKKMFICVHV